MEIENPDREKCIISPEEAIDRDYLSINDFRIDSFLDYNHRIQYRDVRHEKARYLVMSGYSTVNRRKDLKPIYSPKFQFSLYPLKKPFKEQRIEIDDGEEKVIEYDKSSMFYNFTVKEVTNYDLMKKKEREYEHSPFFGFLYKCKTVYKTHQLDIEEFKDRFVKKAGGETPFKGEAIFELLKREATQNYRQN